MKKHLPLTKNRQGDRQKNGGKKISGLHVFAPIFLPFPVPGRTLNLEL